MCRNSGRKKQQRTHRFTVVVVFIPLQFECMYRILSAKPSASMFPYNKCFRGPSAGKLFLEMEEGSFHEEVRVHNLLAILVRANVLLEKKKKNPSLPRASARKQASANPPQTFGGCSLFC